MNYRGYDVFVSMNPLRPGARSRTRDDIERIATVYVDLDANGDAALATLRASKLVPSPSFTIATSPGKFQVIWRVEGLTIAEGEAVNRALAATFGGDPQSTDVARVFRLPGFTNRKYSPPVWIQARRESSETYQLANFRLELTPRAAAPHAKRTYAASPSRVATDIDSALAAAGYVLRGHKATCPLCLGHTTPSVAINRERALYYCHRCKRKGHIGALALAQGKRLEW
jgi:hypothetical protein